jgi:hypothetical protein
VRSTPKKKSLALFCGATFPKLEVCREQAPCSSYAFRNAECAWAALTGDGHLRCFALSACSIDS